MSFTSSDITNLPSEQEGGLLAAALTTDFEFGDEFGEVGNGVFP